MGFNGDKVDFKMKERKHTGTGRKPGDVLIKELVRNPTAEFISVRREREKLRLAGFDLG